MESKELVNSEPTMTEPNSSIDFTKGVPRLLRWLLGIIGVGLMLAIVPVFIPIKWMAISHAWLGLGEFPEQSITLYLARSTSLLYAVHGTLMLIVAVQIRQYWGLVRVFGWLHVGIGAVMFGIDLHSAMPWYWTAVEGIPIAMAGLLIVWLVNVCERTS